MKTRVTLLLYTGQDRATDILRLLEEVSCQNAVIDVPSLIGSSYIGSYVMQLDERDERLPQLRDAIASAAIVWTEKREHIFTQAELETSPLLWLIIRRAERGYGGPKYGTKYDLSQACPRCGTGAIQLSPLHLNPAEIPASGSAFRTLDGEILFSLYLGRILNSANISGLELRAARSHKTAVELPWVQLIGKMKMPPMSPTSKGILRENPCPRCEQDGYFHSANMPIEIEYSSSEVTLDGLSDVVHTYEHFGNSVLREPFEDSHFAQPLLLIKPKVFKVLRKHKVRGLEFVPVNIVEQLS
jgi:hypothetical protein